MSAPRLLISHGDEYTKHILCNVTDGTCYHPRPYYPEPFLNGKWIIGSARDGWLVVSQFVDGFIWLWHPGSGLRIQMPPLRDMEYFRAAVLTNLPMEPDCHIILTAPRSNMVAYCRLGDDEFNIINSYVILATRFSRGRIYGVEALKIGFRLVVLEFWEGNLVVWPLFDLPGTKHNHIKCAYLVESEEGLILVYKMHPSSNERLFGFLVFQVNLERKECVLVDSIGDRTLFVGDFGDSFCCPAAANNTKPNCVYFMRANWSVLDVRDIESGCNCWLLRSFATSRCSFNSWIPLQHSQSLLASYFHP